MVDVMGTRDAAAQTVSGASGVPERGRDGTGALPAIRHALSILTKENDDWFAGLGAVGEVVRSWKAELINDLGGDDAVSTQQRVIIDLAIKTFVILDRFDAWFLPQVAAVDKRTKTLLPMVRERQQLADTLARYMAQLDLKPKAKLAKGPREYAAWKSSNVPLDPVVKPDDAVNPNSLESGVTLAAKRPKRHPSGSGGCPQCGVSLPARDRAHGSPQRYCSAKCRTAAWRARTIRVEHIRHERPVHS